MDHTESFRRINPVTAKYNGRREERTEVASTAVPAAGLDGRGCRLCGSVSTDKPAGADANTALISAIICR